MEKTYKEPQFTLVQTDEQNRVFYSTSGNPGEPSLTPGGSLVSLTNENGAW